MQTTDLEKRVLRSRKRFSQFVSRRYLWSYLLVDGALIALYLVFIGVLSERPLVSDFSKFYMSTRYFWDGKDIYSPVPVETFGPSFDRSELTTEVLHPNLNPPFQTLLLAPLGLFDYRTAFWIWSTLSLLCGLIGSSLIFTTLNTSGEQLSTASRFIPILVYFPTFVALLLGQFSLLLLCLLVSGWIASRSGRNQTAGFLFGMALSLKIFVGIFLIFFLVRRRWRLLGWFVGTTLVCSGLAFLLLGFDSYESYQSALRSVTWYSTSWNASFMGFFTRIFGGSENTPLIDLPGFAHGLALGSSALLVLWLVWFAWPRKDEGGFEHFDLAFSFALVAMLLVSPMGWMYYFPLLLLPIGAAWRYTEVSIASKRMKAMIVATWVLSTIPTRLVQAEDMSSSIGWLLWVGVYFYTLLILCGLLTVLLLRLRSDGVAPVRTPSSHVV